MVKISVKTLDSQTREFEINNSTSIKDFKEKIAPAVNVSPNLQRLIFQGRVLKDDFVLTEEHNGMVLHLVTRPANSGTTQSSSQASTLNSNAESSSNAGNFFAQFGGEVLNGAMSGLRAMMHGNFQNGSVTPSASNPPNFQNNPNASSQMPVHPSAMPQHGPHYHGFEQSNGCIVRQEVEHMKRLLSELDNSLDQLEQNHNSSAPASKESNNKSRSQGGESQTKKDASKPTASDQSESTRSRPSHPTFSDFGNCNSQLLTAQRRFEPFLARLIDFLNRDPPFQSTQSPEYLSTARFLELTLHCQRLMSDVQSVLSRLVIPLDRTPPRGVSILDPSALSSRQRSPMQQQFSSTQRAHPPPRPRAPHPRQQFQNPTNQGFHMRFRVPARGNAPNFTQSSPRLPNANVAGSTPPNMNRVPNPTPRNSSQPYTFVIDTVIEPRIEISVGSESFDVEYNSSDPNHSNNVHQSFTNQQQGPGNAAHSQTATLPVIPGIHPDLLNNIFQSVGNSFQQMMHGGQAQQPGRVVVNGPPGGPNQVPIDLASVLSHVVSSTLSPSQTTQEPVPPQSSTPSTTSNTPSSVSSSTTTTTHFNSPTSTASSAATGGNTQPKTSTQTFTTPSPLLQGGSFGRRAPAPSNNAPNSASFFSNFEQMQRNIPGFNLMMHRPLGEFLSMLGMNMDTVTSQSDSNILSRLTPVIAGQLSMSDIFTMGEGQAISQPKLTRLRNDIRRQVLIHCFNGNTPDAQHIREYSRSSCEDLRSTLQDLFSSIQVRPGVDIVQTNILFLTDINITALNILFFEGDARFFQSMYSHIQQSISSLISLNEHTLQNGRRDLATMLERYTVSTPYGNALNTLVQMSYGNQEPQGRPYEAYVRSMASLYPNNVEESLNRFVVMRSYPPRESDRNSSLVDSDRSKVSHDKSRDASNDPTKVPAEKIKKEGDEQTQKKSENPKKKLNAEKSSSSSSNAQTDNGGINQNNWRNDVPTEWVSIIDNDINAQQKAESQELLSDAYIAGTHTKKP